MLNSCGSPAAKIWIVTEAELPKDKDKGFLFSSPMGWSYRKLIDEAGIKDFYIVQGDKNDPSKLLAAAASYRPPLLVTLDTAVSLFMGGIQTPEQARVRFGSLLRSDSLPFLHYIMPTAGPQTCISDWTERQIVKYVDYGKVKDELDYYQANKVLQPLPEKKLSIDLDFDVLINRLQYWTTDPKVTHLSVDIETVYPREKSNFYGHPGYPVTVGISPFPEFGISFPLFPEKSSETALLWRTLSVLFKAKYIIGQNFFGFDCWFFNMLGINIDRRKIIDTMFRHAVLWPELSHKLEFMTRQYTRQPYYKSEGKGWSIKNLQGLKRYNALDVVTTYDIFLAQEKEFDERPHLR